MKTKKVKDILLVILAAFMSFTMFAAPILAQQGEIMKGRADGEQAAKSNINGTLWMAVGCLGGILGIALAYIYEPTPSSTMLLGKPPEYVAAYTDAYKMTAKKVQTNKAWTGCIVGTLAYIALAVLSASASDSTTN